MWPLLYLNMDVVLTDGKNSFVFYNTKGMNYLKVIQSELNYRRGAS
jgi:hypothetical protein